MPPPTIAFDAMGGDFAPAEIVRGAAQLSLETDLDIILVGDAPRLTALLGETSHNAERIAVHHAPPSPPGASPSSSLFEAARLVAQGRADALVTAGDTGALLRACMGTMQLLPGVEKAALAAVFPTELRRGATGDPFSLILDVGASHEATGRDLVTYALMGAAYARIISRNPVPRVALLASGAGAEREHPAILEAEAELREVADIDFLGLTEFDLIPLGTADVIVTSGLLGALTTRMLEGVTQTVLDLARYAYQERLSWRLGFTMVAGFLRQLKRLTDWEEYGGAPLLGFDRVVIRADRRSQARAIANAGKVASKAVVRGVPRAIAERLAPVSAEPQLAAEG